MGDCKNQMTSKKKYDNKDKNSSLSNVLGLFKSKKAKESPQDKARTFAEMIYEIEDRLVDMIKTKRAELQAEKGDEFYNRKALALLETAGWHLDSVIEIMSSYSDLRK